MRDVTTGRICSCDSSKPSSSELIIHPADLNLFLDLVLLLNILTRYRAPPQLYKLRDGVLILACNIRTKQQSLGNNAHQFGVRAIGWAISSG